MTSLTGASVTFLVFAGVVVLLTNLLGPLAWRRAVLLASSVAFLWLSADGESLLPLIVFVGLGFAGLKLIESSRVRTATPIVVATILIFVWLKRYTFLPTQLFLRMPYTTLGLSYILFRIIHLLEDADSGALPGPVGLISYLIYTLNFTSVVAGPIQRYQEFDKTQHETKRVSVVRAGRAIERIITGFFKANVMALVFSMLKTGAINQIMTTAHEETRMLAGALAIGSYPFFLYCNFSGYIDIVIGMAQLINITLPENFARPFSADSFIGFWSRWHITLSTWLKTYVYNPLLMSLMRRFPADSLAPLWGVIAFFVTFFLVGAWHGQTSAFLFFGVLQGLGVSMNKLYEIVLAARLGRKRVKTLTSNGLYIAISRGLTFTWFAFTLAWFWSNWSQLAVLVTALGFRATISSLALILVAATLGLAVWEAVRTVLLRIEWGEQAVLRSRYTRTAWCTALALISITTELLIRQQAPEMVYKAF
jgi:D-alanyl-lipoteichoic acid acyltransferase DltB (MBOAT superfamily)